MSEPYYADKAVTVYAGDCLDVLREMPDSSVDSVVTDPPYGLEFMGKDWDRFGTDTGNGYREKPRMNHAEGFGGYKERPNFYTAGHPFQAWCQLWATECLRVLKPGGHMLAFGGTRTSHRLACAIEDAGFEIRDSIIWIYGSGFPKSLDVSKAIDKAAGAEREIVGERRGGNQQALHGVEGGKYGPKYGEIVDITAPATPDAEKWQGWGTALKPAHEPIVVARKPLASNVAANVLAYGTGALNIDGCRTDTRDRTDYGLANATRTQGDTYGAPSAGADFNATKGRWPANVALTHSADCGDRCAPGCPVAELDRQSGELTSPGNYDRNAPVTNSGGIYSPIHERSHQFGFGDSGGASRFFYTAKASSAERPFYYRSDCECEGPQPETIPTPRKPDEPCPTCGAGTRRVAHPTVKPLDLMRQLVRLVTPPDGVALDLFGGSGVTAEACVNEDFRSITMELTGEYIPLIMQRISRGRSPRVRIKKPPKPDGHPSLLEMFDMKEETA